MQQMIKSTGAKKALMEELPPGVAAFAIATLFYKFGSFASECVAFLATWYVLSLAYGVVKSLILEEPDCVKG